MFAISLLRRAFAPILRALYGRAGTAPSVLVDTLCQHSRHAWLPRHGFAGLDTLEPRQLLSSDPLSLNAACIRLSPTDANIVQVFDSATPTGTPDYTYSRSALDSLIINGTAGADTLVVDYSNGSPLKAGVLVYNAGAGADSLVLVGRPDYRSTIRPSQATAYSGCVTGYLQSFVYGDVESISASNFSDATLITPHTADDITLNRTSAGVAEITGSSVTSSGTQFLIPGVVISDTPKIILDLAYYDDATGSDMVTLTGVADPSDFSYTLIDFGSGANTLIASAVGTGSTVQLTGPAIDASVSANCELNFISNQTLGTLSLGDGARVAMVPDTFRELCLNSLVMANSASLQLKGGNLVLGVADQPANTTAVPGSLSIGSAAMLDLGAGFMVVNYDPAGTNPIGQIQQDITDAYNPAGGGFWDGTRGLGSSAALYDAVAHGIGYADNFNQLYTHWGPDSQPVTDYSILARYTWLGDANLDGGVNVADLSVILPNYGATSGANWEMGDFNYDGSVDVADLSVMLPNMGHSDNAGLTLNGESASTIVKFNDNNEIAVDQDISISLDWDGNGDAVTSWLIYWMDGAPPQVINSGDLTHVTASHRYTAQGNYPIIAIAETGGLDHFVGMGDLQVNKANPATLIVTATPATTSPVAEGTPYFLTLDAPEGITMWTINWGDGMTENIAGPDATPSHDYKTAPTDPICATATDDTSTYDADPITPQIVLNAPTNVTIASTSANSATLSWQDRSNIESGYEILQSIDGGATWQSIASLPLNSTSFPLSGLDTSKNYSFKVQPTGGGAGCSSAPAPAADLPLNTEVHYIARFSASSGYGNLDPAGGVLSIVCDAGQLASAANPYALVRKVIGGTVTANPEPGVSRSYTFPGDSRFNITMDYNFGDGQIAAWIRLADTIDLPPDANGNSRFAAINAFWICVLDLPEVRLTCPTSSTVEGSDVPGVVSASLFDPVFNTPLVVASDATPFLVTLTLAGDATPGTDYTFDGATFSNVPIPAGQSSATFNVNGLTDTLDEGSEYAGICLTPLSGYRYDSNYSQANVTIYDPPKVSVQATDADASEDACDPGTFTIYRTGGITSDGLTVYFSLGGSAIAGQPGADGYDPPLFLADGTPNPGGTDYVVTGAGVAFDTTSGYWTVGIAAGASSADVTITPVNDALNAEDEEDIELELQAAPPDETPYVLAAAGPTTAQAKLTPLDISLVDSVPLPSMSTAQDRTTFTSLLDDMADASKCDAAGKTITDMMNLHPDLFGLLKGRYDLENAKPPAQQNVDLLERLFNLMKPGKPGLRLSFELTADGELQVLVPSRDWLPDDLKTANYTMKQTIEVDLATVLEVGVPGHDSNPNDLTSLPPKALTLLHSGTVWITATVQFFVDGVEIEDGTIVTKQKVKIQERATP